VARATPSSPSHATSDDAARDARNGGVSPADAARARAHEGASDATSPRDAAPTSDSPLSDEAHAAALDTDYNSGLAHAPRDGNLNGARAATVDALQQDVIGAAHQEYAESRMAGLELDRAAAEVAAQTTLSEIAAGAAVAQATAAINESFEETQEEIREEAAEAAAQLADAEVLSLMAEAAYVQGATERAVGIMDGTTGAKLEIVDVDLVQGDAVYDSATDTTYVERALVDRIAEAHAELVRDGVVTADGTVLDQAAFDVHPASDQVIQGVALIGVHEDVHFVDDTVNQFLGVSYFEAVKAVSSILPESLGQPLEQALLETHAIDAQTNALMAMGVPLEVMRTRTPDGDYLGTIAATINVLDSYAGRPLSFGVSEGQVLEGYAGLTDDGNGAGGRTTRGGDDDAYGRTTRGGDDDAYGRTTRGGDDDAYGRTTRGGEDGAYGRTTRGGDDFAGGRTTRGGDGDIDG
jgi:hypothetical protein